MTAPPASSRGGVVDGLAATRVASTRASPTPPRRASFVAWCAELTQTFSFGITYEYSGLGRFPLRRRQGDRPEPPLHRRARLRRRQVHLGGDAGRRSGKSSTSTARRSASPAGTFKGAPEDAAGQGAFNTINGFLMNLGSYKADARIDVLENGAQQDFLVATIPEPETWMLFGIGLGVVGLLQAPPPDLSSAARRRALARRRRGRRRRHGEVGGEAALQQQPAPLRDGPERPRHGRRRR